MGICIALAGGSRVPGIAGRRFRRRLPGSNAKKRRRACSVAVERRQDHRGSLGPALPELLSGEAVGQAVARDFA